MNVTIKDIAREARVSFATVSRALNGKQGVRVETQQRIREIATRLNYSPNGVARGLVKRRTHTIGLVIPDITNPFYPEVARGIEEAAQEDGYSVFLCNTNWEASRENQYLALLAEKRVDGLIVAPISNVVDEAQERLFGSIPVIYVSNAPRDTERSYVVIDNVRGGFLATRHLIEAGYDRIGFIGAKEGSRTIDERLEGYRLALDRYGMAVDERLIRLGRFTRDAGAATIRAMIGEGCAPRAIFAENDLIAFGVMEGARSLGLTVPGDLAVVGFDDVPFAAYPDVQLTTVCQPKYDMGRMAVRILLEEIAAQRESEGGGRDFRAGSETPGRTDEAARGSPVPPPDARRSAADDYGRGWRAEAASGTARRVILEPELVVRRSSMRDG